MCEDPFNECDESGIYLYISTSTVCHFLGRKKYLIQGDIEIIPELLIYGQDLLLPYLCDIGDN